MPYYMYVAVNEDNKISVFTVDPESGGLTHRHDVAAPGGPFTLAVSPDRNHLYCGTRETPQLISFRIDQSGGGLTQTGTVPLDSWPVYVNTDRRGQVRAVILLPGSTGGCAPHRGRRVGGRSPSRIAGNGDRGSRDADRPDQQLRFRSSHRGKRP